MRKPKCLSCILQDTFECLLYKEKYYPSGCPIFKPYIEKETSCEICGTKVRKIVPIDVKSIGYIPKDCGIQCTYQDKEGRMQVWVLCFNCYMAQKDFLEYLEELR